jgi:prevent-host-death family protein
MKELEKELELREATATFCAVVEAAESGEPTMITKHGRPAAVLISYVEWTTLKARVPSFADLLSAVPTLDPGDLPKRRPARIARKAVLR